VRNGFHDERTVVTAAGAITVKAPRVNDKRIDPNTGERQRFASAILPAWARKSPQVAEVLPLLYLHGLSSGDFAPALTQFLGSAAGLSPATVTRLTAQWQDDAAAFGKRSLAETDFVYMWVDGIHLKVRLEQDKVCLLVMIGVRADGTKELIALADGFRESSESWADLLRDCKRRGMGAPVLAAVIVVTAALIVSKSRWTDRPAIFTFVLFPIVLDLLYRARSGSRAALIAMATCWPRCPSRPTPAPRPRWPRSGARRTGTTP